MPSLWPVVHRLATGEPWPPASSEDATAFVQCATQEALLPLLFAEDDLPQNVRAVLPGFAALARANAARTAMILRAFASVPAVLDGEPFIVLKGCDFATRLYPRPELRPMADVDILIREGDLDRVCRSLERRGFKRTYPGGLATRVPSHHEAAFQIDQVTFEVHHRFMQKPRHPIDYAAIWDRAVPREQDGVLRLSDADAFVYETISIAIKYFVSPLIRFVDLWLLMHAAPDVVVKGAELAREWKARHIYYSVLRYAATLFEEFRDARVEQALTSILSSRKRAFLDRYVIPKPWSLRKRIPPRRQQLWQKYWSIDTLGRRAHFAASHAAATVAGLLRA